MKKPMRRFATEGEASKRFLLASGLEGLVDPDAAVAKAGVALDPLSAPRTGNVVQARGAPDYVGKGQKQRLEESRVRGPYPLPGSVTLSKSAMRCFWWFLYRREFP
jgi:hypothetical protein